MKSLNKLTSFSLLLGSLAAIGLSALPAPQAAAQGAPGGGGGGGAKEQILKGGDATGADSGVSAEDSVKKIVNALLYLVGITAVIVIIIAGFMYMTSAGDPSKASKAKNALLYAVIGLVIAIAAYAIVNWVVGLF